MLWVVMVFVLKLGVEIIVRMCLVLGFIVMMVFCRLLSVLYVVFWVVVLSESLMLKLCWGWLERMCFILLRKVFVLVLDRLVFIVFLMLVWELSVGLK